MNALADAVLTGFPGKRVLVVGDLMLDRAVVGTASRLSPEAPVPVLRSTERRDALGGAANVARNVVALGGEALLAGFVGADEAGAAFRALCAAAGVGCAGLVEDPTRPTTTKTRVLAGRQQLLRIDEEDASPRSAENYDRLAAAVEGLIREARPDALVVSDYAKGVTAPGLLARVIAAATAAGIPVFVDPKGTDWEKYRGARAIKPNRQEMLDFARRWGWSEDPVAAARTLREAAGLDHVALTLGEEGFALVDGDGVRRIPTRAREVYDVTGAGDTVMAAFVLSVAAGLSPAEAADVANHAAAFVIARVGSAVCEADELAQALRADAGGAGRKVYDLPAAARLADRWRAEGRRVVFTNGCFDLLHAGHTGLLQDARALGDRLVLGLNSDASISRLKGPARPLMPLGMRTAVLAALESVDAIVVYETDTPLETIRALRPDVLVKGGDYDRATIVGADDVEGWGGEVRTVPIVHDVSTTRLAAGLARL